MTGLLISLAILIALWAILLIYLLDYLRSH